MKLSLTHIFTMCLQVMFQILSSYLKDNVEHKTVGWLITFLWRNGFKKTVWAIKENYKKLKELDAYD